MYNTIAQVGLLLRPATAVRHAPRSGEEDQGRCSGGEELVISRLRFRRELHNEHMCAGGRNYRESGGSGQRAVEERERILSEGRKDVLTRVSDEESKHKSMP